MKQRAGELGRRLVAYVVLIIALVVIARIVFGAFMGFIHMLVFTAVLIFAVYAAFWARARTRR